MTHRLQAAAVVVTLLAGACSGPEAPVDVAAKNVPIDLLLGAKRAVARAPVPPVAFDVDGVGNLVLPFDLPGPSIVRRTRTTKPPEGCVENLLAVPATEAPRSTLLSAPDETTYTFAVKGSWKVGAAESAWPPTATVEVLNARDVNVPTGPPKPDSPPPNLDTTWDLAVTLNGVKTTTSYRARPLGPGISQETDAAVDEQAAAYPEGDPFRQSPALDNNVDVPPNPADKEENPNPPGGLPPGLYMEKIQKDGQPVAFEPRNGLLLARFPITIGEKFDVSGSDGATTMSYRTKVTGKKHVHACGKAIDTWTVELIDGRIADARTGEVVTFAARYQVATLFGGLIVENWTHVEGTQVPPVPVVRTVEMATTTPPKVL